MKQTNEIVVSPNGDISIDAVGFKGVNCERATEFLEKALGVTARKIKKPEFHQQNRKTNQQRIDS